MCQAIAKPSGVKIEKEVLRRAWNSNPHGAGFAYRDTNRVVTYTKGFFKFKKFWTSYRKHQDKDVLIHFRYATHGEMNVENCHPFKLGEDSAIAHNGILYRFEPEAKDPRSDTRLFVEDYLNPALKATGVGVTAFLKNHTTVALLERLIERGNKMVALTPDGFLFLNENQGEWHEKVWWSAGYPEDLMMYGMYRSSNTSPAVRPWEKLDWNNCQTWDALDIDEDMPLCEEEEDTTCTACNLAAPRLYTMGEASLCGDCWMDYTN